MNDTLRERSLNIVCLIAPVFTILVVQLAGLGPSAAHASGSGMGFVALPSVPDSVTPDRDPIQHDGIVSPFPEFDDDESLQSFGSQESDGRAFVVEDEFELTSVMPSAVRPLAVINGRPCRPGHSLGGGWTLTSVESSGRGVTITHRSGRTKNLTLSTSGN